MPIVVDYTPVGALAGLAQKAGRNQAAQQSFENSLRVRSLNTQATQGLLSYLLQKKAMGEKQREFDLSRQDERERFAVSMGARSAAIRQSQEQANQAFTIQMAAARRADRAQELAWRREQRLQSTAETPQQKFERTLAETSAVGGIEQYFKEQNRVADATMDYAKKAYVQNEWVKQLDAQKDVFERSGINTEASKMTPGTFQKYRATPKPTFRGPAPTSESIEAKERLGLTKALYEDSLGALNKLKAKESQGYILSDEQAREKSALEHTVRAYKQQWDSDITTYTNAIKKQQEKQTQAYADWQAQNSLVGRNTQQAASTPAGAESGSPSVSVAELQEAEAIAGELKQRYPDKSDAELGQLLRTIMEARARGRR